MNACMNAVCVCVCMCVWDTPEYLLGMVKFTHDHHSCMDIIIHVCKERDLVNIYHRNVHAHAHALHHFKVRRPSSIEPIKKSLSYLVEMVKFTRDHRICMDVYARREMSAAHLQSQKIAGEKVWTFAINYLINFNQIINQLIKKGPGPLR